MEIQRWFAAEGSDRNNTVTPAYTMGDIRAKISLGRPYKLVGMPLITELTIPQLDRITSGMANWYYAKGVQPKDPIVIFLEDDIAYLLHYLALTKIGAIPVFLDKKIESNTAIQLINEVDAVAVVSEPGRLRDDWLYIRFFNPNQIVLDISNAHYRFEHHDDDPILITYTSGSPDAAKPILFKFKDFYSGARRQMKYTIGLRSLLALPLSEATALATLMSALMAGSNIKIADGDDIKSLLSTICDYKPDLVASTPAIFDKLASANLDIYDLDSVSCWLGMGDTHSASTIHTLTQYGYRHKKEVLEKGSRFIDAFSSPSFCSSLFEIVHKSVKQDSGRCLGKPFDWVEAQVFDDKDSPVPVMTPGKLGVKASTALSGYWNNSLLTERKRVQGYWLTGDYVYKSSDGCYYHV